MAVPKKRKSKSKTRSRRSHNRKMTIINSMPCPHCAEPKLPHRACGSCGKYGSKENPEDVIEVWEY